MGGSWNGVSLWKWNGVSLWKGGWVLGWSEFVERWVGLGVG